MRTIFLSTLMAASIHAAPAVTSAAEKDFEACVYKLSRDKFADRKIPFLLPLGLDDRLIVRGALLAPDDPKLSRQFLFVHKGRIFVKEFPDVVGNSGKTEKQIDRMIANDMRNLTFVLPVLDENVGIHDYFILDDKIGETGENMIAPGVALGSAIEDARLWLKVKGYKFLQTDTLEAQKRKMAEFKNDAGYLLQNLKDSLPKSIFVVPKEVTDAERLGDLKALLLKRLCPEKVAATPKPAAEPKASGAAEEAPH